MLSAAGSNRLIETLPKSVKVRLLAAARPVDLAAGQVLARAGGRIRHVYFPTDSLIAECGSARGSAGLDLRLIGAEAVLGVSLALGVGVAPLQAVVRHDGVALRIRTADFRRQLLASPVLVATSMRHVQAILVQLARAATCNSFHLLDARLARLLLTTQDRRGSAGFHLTHEVLATRLGVRRAGVSAQASALQHRGLISYRRGDITIEDRDGLSNVACECYAADLKSSARIMGRHVTGGRGRA